MGHIFEEEFVESILSFWLFLPFTSFFRLYFQVSEKFRMESGMQSCICFKISCFCLVFFQSSR